MKPIKKEKKKDITNISYNPGAQKSKFHVIELTLKRFQDWLLLEAPGEKTSSCFS